ncbi:hypothetical protein FACS1894137_14030 [Spirochaetia bacterium]|nr:hypothetical protein FACS1894137_14030 [Spirochaetia bacterium]
MQDFVTELVQNVSGSSGKAPAGITLAELAAFSEKDYDKDAYTVVVNGNERFEGSILYNREKPVTITIRGGRNGGMIISTNKEKNLFVIGKKVTLILENVFLRGDPSAEKLLIDVRGTLIINEGVTIIGPKTNYWSAVGINGNCIMNGGSINNTCIGVAIFATGNFTMNGGIISDNENRGVGIQGGVFEMTGGIIKDNKIRGVTFAGDNGGTFVMRGGTISGNKSYGVFVSKLGTFRRVGGDIYGNGQPDVYNQE